MATTYYEIPLNAGNQRFNVALGGVQYSMLLQWRGGPDAGWFVDIASVAGVPILSGVPLVTGADLLAQYTNLGFKGQLRVATDGTPDAVPTSTNLGNASHVYFGVPS